MGHVVVVGAGVAGLCCAWSLHQRGHDVEVLESGGSLGGQVRSQRIEGYPFERGARWLGEEPELHDLLARLQLSDCLRTLAPPSFVLGPDGLAPVEPGNAILPGEPVPTGLRYTLEGGLSRLTRALAEPLTLRLGWGAQVVETDSLGVRVEYVAPSGERSVRAEAAVLALPGPAARGLAAELPPPTRSAPVPTERFGLVHLGLADPVAEGDVRIPAIAGLGIAGWSATRCSEGTALRVALRTDAVDRLWSAPDTAWVDHVTGQLERTPLEKLEPVLCLVDRFRVASSEPDSVLWAGRLGVTGAAGSIAGAVSRGLLAANGADRVLRARVIQ